MFIKLNKIKLVINSSFILILFFLLASCASNKDKADAVEDRHANNAPKIIFLNYILKKNPDSSIKATLYSKTIVEGTVKKPAHSVTNTKAGNLVCVQLDQHSRVLDDSPLSNPLLKDIEYVSPDGALDKKQIELDSTETSVRIQLDPHTKFISLELIGEPNIQLLKTTL